MKRQFRYLMLTTLVIMFTSGAVFAQPVPIGADRQPNPFESNASTYTATSMGAVGNPAQMYDGNLLSAGNMKLGSGFVASANLLISSFDVPVNPFTIEWVDLKIKYHVPMPTTDDQYRIEYTTDGVNWVILSPNTGQAFDMAGGPPAMVPFAQIMPTDGGAWTWGKLGSLQLRIWCTRGGFGWDNKDLYVYEVWATVYPLPLPPVSSPTISIQPNPVTTGPTGMYAPNYFFVDIYVMDMVNMLGYELVIGFDPGVIKAIQALSYYPFKNEIFAPVLDNVAGYVSMSYYTFGGDPDGLTGNGPVARMYFQVGDIGVPPTSSESLITFDVSKISDVLGGRIDAATHYGLFRIARYWSATDSALNPISIDLTSPIGTHWHEIYPTYSEEYDIANWEDNDDGVLSASDNIGVAHPGGSHTDWYRVEEVTITMWFTIKAGDPYGWDGLLMAAEPEEPTTELLSDPIGSKWHQSSPPDFYSLTFTITSWDDGGDGYFSPSDQFDYELDFDPGIPHWAHLDAVSTDI
ncbi:MAG: cohesin domain-containing protein, partial [Candidatus Bathyarchaeota archaeon]